MVWPFPDGQLNHGQTKWLTLDCPSKRCFGFSLECILSPCRPRRQEGLWTGSDLTMRITSTSCICPVLVCLCFVQRCYGTAHHSSIKVTRNQTKHTEGETEVHHRPKRGWVWNQFFVLEEHMGPDPQYVGKVSLFWFSWNSLLVFLLLRNHRVRWRSWRMNEEIRNMEHTIENCSLDWKTQTNYRKEALSCRIHLLKSNLHTELFFPTNVTIFLLIKTIWFYIQLDTFVFVTIKLY